MHDLYSLMQAGIKAHLSGRLEKALEIYGTVLTLDPGNPVALYNLGCVFEEAGYVEEAKTSFALARETGKFRQIEDKDIVGDKPN
jgi:tetratricopeptide (TPR) repeat protein